MELNPKSRNNTYIGIIFFIPIIIIMINFIVIPFFNVIIKSFTFDNFIDKPRYVGFENYQRLFKDHPLIIGIKNSFLSAFFSTIITIGISSIFAWFSRKLNIYLKSILSIMFLIGSVTTVVPIGLLRVFSSGMYPYSGNEIMYSPLFLQILTIIVPILIGFGPLYLLFTIYYISKGHFKNYLHLASVIQILISFLSFRSIIFLTGVPSFNYFAHTISAHIYDYQFFRYDVGYASTLIVVMGIMIVFFILLFNGLIWVIFKITGNEKNEIVNESKNYFLDIMIFLFLFIISIILVSPSILAFLDSFKSLNEIFAYPNNLVPRKPTLINYHYLFDNINLKLYFINTIKVVFISTFLIFIVNFTCCIGFSMANNKFTKIFLDVIVVSIILSPVVLFSIDHDYSKVINISIIFNSLSLGFSIVLCKKIIYPTKILKSILGIGSVSLLSSLFVLYNRFLITSEVKKQTFIQLLETTFKYGGSSRAGINSSLMVLSLILPIMLLILTISLILLSLSTSKKSQYE